MTFASDNGSRVIVTNTSPVANVSAAVYYSSASYNALATDKSGPSFLPDTLNMRNQAQTEQLEMESTGTSFSMDLQLSATCADCDQDGLPDAWEIANSLSFNDDGSTDEDNGGTGDPDEDGMDNITEHLLGLNPQLADTHLFPQLRIIRNADASITLDFPTIADRRYRLWWSDSLDSWTRLGADIITLGELPNLHRQVDDAGQYTSSPNLDDQNRRFYRLEVLLP